MMTLTTGSAGKPPGSDSGAAGRGGSGARAGGGAGGPGGGGEGGGGGVRGRAGGGDGVGGRLALLPVAGGLEGGGGGDQGGLLEMPADQHQAERQPADHAARHGEGGMAADV